MNNAFFIWDDPYQYKDILIYPVTMDKYYEFNACASCLLIEKNKIPDKKIIKMSYLDYFFYMVQQQKENMIYLDMLIYLLNLIFREQKYSFYEVKNNKINFLVGDKSYDSTDFDEIRKIICEQNGLNFERKILHPELEQALKEAKEFKESIGQSSEMCGLEDQLIAYHTSTGVNYEDIKKMSIRKFVKGLQWIDRKMHYQIAKTAELSGFVSFKESITHWLNKVEKQDAYADVVVEAESVLGKISKANS